MSSRLPGVVAGVSLCAPCIAFAYATAVVFTPTGEAMAGGMVCGLGYVSTNLAPEISPAATWFGVEVGLLPGIMEISPALPSMNFIYGTATKTLQFGKGPSLGRLRVIR